VGRRNKPRNGAKGGRKRQASGKREEEEGRKAVSLEMECVWAYFV
jgi:hypothetical protein